MSPVTRRQLLSTGALTALGAAVAGPAGSLFARGGADLPRAAAAPAPAPRRAAAARALTAPFTLTADTTLSEDWFVTAQVQVDPAAGDQVLPVIRSDGSTVVLVLSASSGPSLALPSATAPGGFTFTAAPALAGATGVAAGPADTVVVYGVTDIGAVWARTVAADGTIGAPVTLADGDALSAMTSVQPVSGSTRAVFLASDAATDVWLVQTDGTAAGTVSMPVPAPVDTSADDLQLGVFPAVEPDTLVGVVLSEEGVYTHFQPSAAGTDIAEYPIHLPDGSLLDSPEALVAHVITAPVPGNGDPNDAFAMLYLDQEQVLWAAMCSVYGMVTSSPVQLLTGEGFTGGQVTSATWYRDPGTGLIAVFVLAGQTLYLQYVDFTTPQATATPPLPLQTGVVGAYLPDLGVSASSPLVLAVTLPGYELPGLVTLQRRGLGTWVTTPVLQSDTHQAEVACYRTHLTLLDANGLRVPGATVTVTPALDITAFRPTGALPLPAGVGTPVITDALGQVTLATPATALHTAAISLAWDDGAGAQGLLTVAPDGPLHAFLAGGPPIGGHASVYAVLQANPAALPKLPTDDATLTAVAGAITASVQAAASPDTATGFSLTGVGTPGIAVGTPPAGGLRGVDSSWWDDLAGDLESAWHAVEHGVAQVSSMVCAKGASGWVVSLALDVVGYAAQQAISYVITDLRSAMAAVGGVFHALGADVAAAVDLLKDLVSSLFDTTRAVGATLYDWLTGSPTGGLPLALSAVQDLQTKIDFSCVGLTSSATSGLATVAAQGTVSPASVAANAPAGSGAVGGLHTNGKAHWLLDKTKSAAVPHPGVAPSAPDAFTALAAAYTGDPTYASAASAALAAGPQVSAPGDIVSAFTLSALEAMLEATLDAGMRYLDETMADLLGIVADGLTQLDHDLRLPLGDLPVIGDLFSAVLDVGSVTVGEAFCYVLGFAVAVAGELFYPGKPDWFVLDGSTGPQRLPSPTGVGDAPAWAANVAAINLVVTIISTGITTALDASDTPPGGLRIAGIVSSAVLTAVSFPFDPAAKTFDWAPYDDPTGGKLGRHGPVVIWALGFIPPLLDLAVALAELALPDAADKIQAVADFVVPWLDSLVGGVSIELGVFGAEQAGEDLNVVLGVVMANAGYAGKLFAIGNLLDVVSAVLDLGAGLGAAFLDFTQL